jgi:hypothetical protein
MGVRWGVPRLLGIAAVLIGPEPMFLRWRGSCMGWLAVFYAPSTRRALRRSDVGRLAILGALCRDALVFA